MRLFTRRGFDWTDRYPLIAKAAATLRASSAVIDGEAVFCDEAGVANFEKLHSRAHDDRVFLYAFDLLELDGVDHRPLPLEARKGALAKLLKPVRRAQGTRSAPCSPVRHDRFGRSVQFGLASAPRSPINRSELNGNSDKAANLGGPRFARIQSAIVKRPRRRSCGISPASREAVKDP